MQRDEKLESLYEQILNENVKPDFPDLDKDGDTTEPISQAAKQAAEKDTEKEDNDGKDKDNKESNKPQKGKVPPQLAAYVNKKKDLEEALQACLHPDEEGGMIMNQLETILSSANKLKSLIKDPKAQLPAWVQSKITLAEDYIITVANYIESGQKIGDPEVSNVSVQLKVIEIPIKTN